MKKFILLPFLIFYFSCENSTYNAASSTLSDYQETLETARKQEKQLKSQLQIVSDLDIGIEKALKENKPILLYFTGYALLSGRKIERNLLLKNEKIFQTLKNDYINVWLYVDDISGEKNWFKYQVANFKSNVQPYFVILNSFGKPLSEGMGTTQAKRNLGSELLKYK